MSFYFFYDSYEGFFCFYYFMRPCWVICGFNLLLADFLLIVVMLHEPHAFFHSFIATYASFPYITPLLHHYILLISYWLTFLLSARSLMMMLSTEEISRNLLFNEKSINWIGDANEILNSFFSWIRADRMS